MSRFSQKSRTRPGLATTNIQAVDSAYQALQRAQRGLVGMVIVCAFLGTFVLRVPPGELGNRSYLPVIFATSLLAFAYTLRNSLVLPSLAELRRNPRDPELLRRWSRNNLIVQGLCTAVGLSGFGVQLMGAALPIALALYAIAVSYLFLLRPVRP